MAGIRFCEGQRVRRSAILSLYTLLVLLMFVTVFGLAACGKNWDEDGSYGYAPFPEETQFVEQEPAPQITQERANAIPCVDGGCEEKKITVKHDLTLPIQGPCAAWEAGCFIEKPSVAPSFEVAWSSCRTDGNCPTRGRCQTAPKAKAENEPARTHCFRRQDGWTTCY